MSTYSVKNTRNFYFPAHTEVMLMLVYNSRDFK